MNQKTSTSLTDTSATKGDAPSTTTSVTDDAKLLLQDAKNAATGALNQAKHTAEDRVTSGKDRLVEGIGSVAEALRSTGKGLESKDQLGVTGYLSTAADTVESASKYLEGRQVGEIVSDIEAFARREPAIFLGGSFALGLMLSRFLKASSRGSKSTAMVREQDSYTYAGGDFRYGTSAYGTSGYASSPYTPGAGSRRRIEVSERTDGSRQQTKPYGSDMSQPRDMGSDDVGVSSATGTPRSPSTNQGSGMGAKGATNAGSSLDTAPRTSTSTSPTTSSTTPGATAKPKAAGNGVSGGKTNERSQ